MRLIRATTLKTLPENPFPLITQMIIFQFDLTNFMQASLLLPLQGGKLQWIIYMELHWSYWICQAFDKIDNYHIFKARLVRFDFFYHASTQVAICM